MIWSTASVILLALTSASNCYSTRRQDGPVDPSTTRSCTYYDTAIDKSYNCAYFESFWGISHINFVAWNPSVKSDCSGLKVGNSYCVEVLRPTTTTTATSTASPKPSPTQDGLIKSCATFYKAVRGDNCDKIVAKYGTFTNAQFLQWNPAVGSDCSGLYADTYYCVGVPGTPTTSAASTSTKPANGITTPSPTHHGIVNNCDSFYLVKSGDDCQTIADKHGITLPQFVSWQDVGGASCRSLQANVYACISIIGHTPSTTRATTTTTRPTNGVTTPTPTQIGMVANCDAFYFVKSGDGCQTIADDHGITLSQLTSWQNVGGASCTNLQANVYVCVSIIGHTPSSIHTTTTTTKPANGITTPTPTQPGMVGNCDSFYLVRSGDGCQAIADKSGITLSQFTSWQSVGGASCTSLQANVYVCISIIGHTPSSIHTTTTTTKPANGITTPTPTQPGMVGNCDSFYLVRSGDGCQAIADKSGITLSQLISWQSVGGASCSSLQANVYVCISIIGHTATFTTTSKTPTTTTCPTAHPSPTQPGGVCNCKRWHKVVSGNTCDTIRSQYGITTQQFNTWNPEVGTNCSRLWLGYYVCVSA